MDSLLYESAMQVVPVLVIAVFVDGRTAADPRDERALRRDRTQSRISAVLALTAFMLSMLVVARVVQPSSGTLAVVVSAIGGTVGLLLLRIWRHLDEPLNTLHHVLHDALPDQTLHPTGTHSDLAGRTSTDERKTMS